MQTLHEMLKRQPDNPPASDSASEELGRRYSKIGISAVAAAAQFNGVRETKSTIQTTAADRSSARGWSRHK